MSVSVFTAARYLCEKSGNSLTDMELCRFLYIAQMMHLGLYKRPIFDENFEAWEPGPVQPDLYHAINSAGVSAHKNLLRRAKKLTEGSEKDILDQTYEQASQIKQDELVAVTHWEKGAWAKSCDADYPHAVIEHGLMRQEYIDRVAAENLQRMRRAG